MKLCSEKLENIQSRDESFGRKTKKERKEGKIFSPLLLYFFFSFFSLSLSFLLVDKGFVKVLSRKIATGLTALQKLISGHPERRLGFPSPLHSLLFLLHLLFWIILWRRLTLRLYYSTSNSKIFIPKLTFFFFLYKKKKVARRK